MSAHGLWKIHHSMQTAQAKQDFAELAQAVGSELANKFQYPERVGGRTVDKYALKLYRAALKTGIVVKLQNTHYQATLPVSYVDQTFWLMPSLFAASVCVHLFSLRPVAIRTAIRCLNLLILLRHYITKIHIDIHAVLHIISITIVFQHFK